jgi:formylglycine-generating enzyme required for sulfatase activity
MTHRGPPAPAAGGTAPATPATQGGAAAPAAKPVITATSPAPAPPAKPALAAAPPAAPLPAAAKPAWASAAGHDASGAWTELRVGDALQRLRWMPPATFLVGSLPDEPNYIGPESRATATVSQGFWIADSECTQGLWRAVMGGNPAEHTGDDRLPVEHVSFYDAIAFTKALSRLLPPLRARLPSRDEWEYACRAGTSTWWWCGNDAAALPLVANLKFAPGLGGRTQPVASLRANPWGLYDVHGNVAEWALGRNYERPARTLDAETDPDDRNQHVGLLKGGSYASEPPLGRSGALPYVGTDGRNPDIGFRFIVVGDPPPPAAR